MPMLLFVVYICQANPNYRRGTYLPLFVSTQKIWSLKIVDVDFGNRLLADSAPLIKCKHCRAKSSDQEHTHIGTQGHMQVLCNKGTHTPTFRRGGRGDLCCLLG